MCAALPLAVDGMTRCGSHAPSDELLVQEWPCGVVLDPSAEEAAADAREPDTRLLVVEVEPRTVCWAPITDSYERGQGASRTMMLCEQLRVATECERLGCSSRAGEGGTHGKSMAGAVAQASAAERS